MSSPGPSLGTSPGSSLAADLAHLAAKLVPRYTSYPTAPHFHAGLKAATYSEWLAALPVVADLSLYMHVPFCDSL